MRKYVFIDVLSGGIPQPDPINTNVVKRTMFLLKWNSRRTFQFHSIDFMRFVFHNSGKEIEEFDLYMHAYSFYYTKRLMKAATVFQLKKIVLRNVHAIESCLMHRGLKREGGGIRNKYGIRNAEVSCLNLNNINLNYS